MHFGVQQFSPFFPPLLDKSKDEIKELGFGYSLVNLLEEQLNFKSEFHICIEYNCVRRKHSISLYNAISFPILNMHPHDKDSFGWRFVTINVPAV
jgi:hypothetical protein